MRAACRKCYIHSNSRVNVWMKLLFINPEWEVHRRWEGLKLWEQSRTSLSERSFNTGARSERSFWFLKRGCSRYSSMKSVFLSGNGSQHGFCLEHWSRLWFSLRHVVSWTLKIKKCHTHSLRRSLTSFRWRPLCAQTHSRLRSCFVAQLWPKQSKNFSSAERTTDCKDQEEHWVQLKG